MVREYQLVESSGRHGKRQKDFSDKLSEDFMYTESNLSNDSAGIVDPVIYSHQ